MRAFMKEYASLAYWTNLNEDKGFSFLRNGVVTYVNRYGVAIECA
jgi:hypothetical protein